MTARRLWLRRREQAVQRTVPPPRQPEQEWPRLVVSRVEPGLWWWQIYRPDGTGPGKAARSHPEALAVGLAALEQASIPGRMGA